MPKNLGTITDPKDIITKEYLEDYVATNVASAVHDAMATANVLATATIL